MSEIFAGIAIFPSGADEYNVAISLVSDGSLVHNKSTSSPVTIDLLTETVKAMIFSTFTGPTPIKTYFTSVPPGFPPDQYYEVFNALECAQLVDKFDYPALPLSHGESYSITLPNKPRRVINLLTLDFSCPNHLYVGTLASKGSGGRRVNTIIHELSVSLGHDASFEHTLRKILTSLDGTNVVPDQILLIKPPVKPKEARIVDMHGVVAKIYPKIPILKATIDDIAHAAANFAYAKFLLINGRVRAKYFMAMPVSVATASGAIVPIARSFQTLPVEVFVTLTNSVDNQKSATVNLLIGNHSQAKNNLLGAVMVLSGLMPLPQGEARIRVALTVMALDGRREAAQIAVTQEGGGPQKTFLFRRFFADLPKDCTKYDIHLKREPELVWKSESEVVAGTLPE